jgi:hypothetical protein
MKLVVRTALVAQLIASLAPHFASAQTKPPAKVPARATAPKAPLSDSARADSLERALLEADARYFEQQLRTQRATLLKGASWADLGTRCNAGNLRVFPAATTTQQQDSIKRLVEHMEQTLIGRGVGSRLDTPEARALLRTIVGWEAGIDRPLWDVDTKEERIAMSAGLTGEYADPKGPGCLPSPMNADTVTFVVPGFSSMEFPKATRPRVKAYFGPEGQRHARDEFFAARGSKDPTSELSYIVVAPMLIWRGWALVGVDRPREKGGVEIGTASNGGAVYMMRKVGQQWRLVTIVRTWG